MLDLTITQAQFEHILPVFQSPTEHLFERLAHEIAVATEDIHLLVQDYADDSRHQEAISQEARAYICCQAARRTLPQLDLVLTETGFGVVSNNNVVPASQARVAALDESLRRKTSKAYDTLLLLLLRTSWCETAEACSKVTALLWLPVHARRHGVQLEGKPIYEEEFYTIRPIIANAESRIQEIISPELYEYLLEQERTAQASMTPTLQLLINQARLLIVALMKECPHGAAVRPLVKKLLLTLDKHKDELPAYTSSSTYEAHHLPPYENKKTDTIFFFS